MVMGWWFSPTAKIETLCSRFYADTSISVTGDEQLFSPILDRYLNFIPLGLSVKLYTGMISSYGNISRKPNSTEFPF